MNRSSSKKNISSMLFGFFFLVIIFSVTSCNDKKASIQMLAHLRVGFEKTNSPISFEKLSKRQTSLSACLTSEEKADLEYFFRLLIFENYGAFVLFGSKPLCDMSFSDTESTTADAAFQQWYDSLPDDTRAKLKARMKNKTQIKSELERNLYRGWLAWEKVRKNFQMKNYILRITPLRGMSSYELMLMNVQQTARIMAENYTVFKDAGGMDFQPLQAVFEFQNHDSIFWKNIFSAQNHVAKGLLFGFGLKNSIFGHLRFTYSNIAVSSELKRNVVKHLKKAAPSALTTQVKLGDARPSNFRTPLFCAIEGDDTAEKYTKEKLEIEKIYRGQDLVEVTLQRLAS